MGGLLHSLEALPADVPGTVVGEAWVEGLGAAVPTGTHHGDGGEQGAVAGQIDAQAIGRLEVMSVDEVGILLRIDEQGVEGGFGIAESGGCHRNHTVVPAPCGGPVPVVHYPMERGFHFYLIIYRVVGEKAASTEDGGMIGATFVGKCLRGFACGVEGIEGGFGRLSHRVFICHRTLAGGVDAVLLGEGGDVLDDVVPEGEAGLALALAPFVGYGEAVAPIGQFEGLVVGDVLGDALLHGGGASQLIAACGFIECDEVGHELGGGFYLLAVFLQRFGRGVGAIHLLGEVDVMGLLPDEEGARV